MAYRAQLGGQFGGGNVPVTPPPALDVASIIDAVVGAKASLTHQAIMRAQAQREIDAQQHTRSIQDAELALAQQREGREAQAATITQAAERARMLSEGYDPDTKTYDPTKSGAFQLELAKRQRIVEEYMKLPGMTPEKAVAAADNPRMLSYFMGYHDKTQKEGDGLTADQKAATHALGAVNSQVHNTEEQLNRTPLPKRPETEDKTPLMPPSRDDPLYRADPRGFVRDSIANAAYVADSTAAAGKRQRLTTRLDSLNGVQDRLAARVQGMPGGAAAPASAPAPVAAPGGLGLRSMTSEQRFAPQPNPAQADYDAAAAAFKAGPNTPERQAKYSRALSAIAAKHGQMQLQPPQAQPVAP